MAKLRVASFSISLDGLGAGPAQSLENPLGFGGAQLHAWAFPTRTLRRTVFGSDGGTTGLDDELHLAIAPVLLGACERVFATLEEAQEELQRERKRAEGRIRLGATVEFGTSVLMRHIRPFLEAHPGIEMDFHLSHDLLTPLLRDDVDLAIDCVSHPHADLERTPLFREAYMVACAPDYLAAHRVEEPADLARCAVLSLDKGCSWWERFLAAFPKGRRPAFGRVVAINHIRGLITAAVSGLGVVLAPSYSLKGELDRGALVPLFPAIRPLEDRFSLYQKAGRARLARHRLLTEYLQGLTPSEFGA